MMRIVEYGHTYLLDPYDGGDPVVLTFVKRNTPPEKYPGNSNSHPGTITQEVLRALLERTRYVNNQIPHPNNLEVIGYLRESLFLLEERANSLHGRHLEHNLDILETMNSCKKCGHVQCGDHMMVEIERK